MKRVMLWGVFFAMVRRSARRNLLTTLGALVLVLAAVGSTQAITLTDLYDGGSITSGDKLFDQFQFSRLESTTGPVDTDNIIVSEANGGVSYGLQFDISNSEFRVTGPGEILYAFQYHVSILDPTFMTNGSSVGDFSSFLAYDIDGSNDNGVRITTQLVDNTLSGYLGDETLEFSISDNVTTSISFDSDTFDLQSGLWVYTMFDVWALDSTDSAGLNGFTQLFRQVPVQVPVPEPSTFLLLGGGLIGLAFAVRRRRKE